MPCWQEAIIGYSMALSHLLERAKVAPLYGLHIAIGICRAASCAAT